MIVYCSHSRKNIYPSSNFIKCSLCMASWYTNDPTPMVIVGYTEPYEVDKDYLEHLEPKDLTQKKFNRCNICKDLLEKRRHRICQIKSWWKQITKRHIETISRISKVIKGCKK